MDWENLLITSDQQIVADWVESHYPIIMDIYIPLAQHEYSLLMNYDNVFRDTIRENFNDTFYSMLCIEFARSTGMSTEVFYSVFDKKKMNELIYRLEDLKNDDVSE